MKYSELPMEITYAMEGSVSNPDVKVLTPASEILEVVGFEFEPDNQNGNDVLWIRTDLR